MVWKIPASPPSKAWLLARENASTPASTAARTYGGVPLKYGYPVSGRVESTGSSRFATVRSSREEDALHAAVDVAEVGHVIVDVVTHDVADEGETQVRAGARRRQGREGEAEKDAAECQYSTVRRIRRAVDLQAADDQVDDGGEPAAGEDPHEQSPAANARYSR